MKAVKDADPAGIVEEECLDICGGFDSILSSFHLLNSSQMVHHEYTSKGPVSTRVKLFIATNNKPHRERSFVQASSRCGHRL
jgi:hypothetical protein